MLNLLLSPGTLTFDLIADRVITILLKYMICENNYSGAHQSEVVVQPIRVKGIHRAFKLRENTATTLKVLPHGEEFEHE